MIYPTHDDIIYAAGFVDGDGCISMYKHKPRPPTRRNPSYGIKVSVANTAYNVLQWFSERWEGGIPEVSTAPAYRKRAKKRFWEWKIYGDRAYQFIKQVRPYLQIKSAEADIALEFYKNKAPVPGGNQSFSPEEIARREWYFQRIQKAHGSKSVLIDNPS